MPPIFQPEVGADAVYWAAHHHPRELYVGMPTVEAIVGTKIAPRLLDRYLGRTGYASQQTSEPEDPNRPDNLWEPATGQTFHDLIGTNGQQDVDLERLFMDVAAYSERVMGPTHVIDVLDIAIKTALGRRTVAHVTIPKDVQEWTVEDDERSAANVEGHSADRFEADRPLPPTARLQDKVREVV